MHQYENAIRAERAAAAAFADLCYAAPPELVQTLRMDTQTFDSVIATCASGWNTPHINRVFGLGIDHPASESLVDQIIAFYAPDSLAFAVNVSPVAQPSYLSRWLTDRGFVHDTNTAIVIRDVRDPDVVTTSINIRSIDSSDASVFADILVNAFPLPPFFAAWLAATVGHPHWRHYLAYENDRAVAAASLFIHQQTAVLNWSATLESHRRRGVQRALIARRIRDAHTLGCTLVTSDTDEDTDKEPSWSYRNLLKSGFKLLYVRPTYVLPNHA